MKTETKMSWQRLRHTCAVEPYGGSCSGAQMCNNLTTTPGNINAADTDDEEYDEEGNVSGTIN